MGKHMKWFIWVLLVVVAILWVRWELRPEPIEVKVATVEKGVVERTVANTRAGSVKSCRRAKLSPSLGGQIARLEVKEGSRVMPGDLLLELWNDDIKAEVVLAERQAVSAQASAKAACLNADKAQREADRLARLKESGAVSVERIDQAQTTAEAHKAECEASSVQAEVSKARLGVAKANLERTRLHAPFEGVVAEINGELNEYVTPSPPGIATLPVIDLIDNYCFFVSAPIDEVDAMGIKTGMEANITLDAFDKRKFAASIRRIACYVLDLEKQARTVEVEAEFANQEDLLELLAGYSADVEIVLERKKAVLRVPTEAVMEDSKVLLYDPAEGVLKQQKIEVGISNWKYSEITKGLKAGDQILLSVDKEGVADGVAVKIEP